MQKQFEHDCDRCTFLGAINLREEENLSERAQNYANAYEGKYDLYHCDQGGLGGTVIARYGNDGPDYMSGASFAKPELNVPLYRARLLAEEKNLKLEI